MVGSGVDKVMEALLAVTQAKRCQDKRANFVTYHQSYLLYLWHILEKYDLMSSSMQRLDKSIPSSNGADGIPSIINCSENESEVSLSETGSLLRSKKAKLTAGQLIIQDGFDKLNKSIFQLSETSAKIAEKDLLQAMKDKESARLDNKKKEIRSNMNQLFSTNNSLNVQHRSFLEEDLDGLRKDVAKIEHEIAHVERRLAELE